jgi:plasmid replication initiation protein
MNAIQAEENVDKNMTYLGYNTEMVDKALVDTLNNFKTNHTSCIRRLDSFCNSMLMKPHKHYPKKEYPFEFRFVLTLILGYLNKLDSVAIINCDNPEIYFLGKISNFKAPELTKALDQTRRYVEESGALVLAEGMRKVEAWFEEIAKENIPTKELTIADIEKQLGYKIKIVGEEK